MWDSFDSGARFIWKWNMNVSQRGDCARFPIWSSSHNLSKTINVTNAFSPAENQDIMKETCCLKTPGFISSQPANQPTNQPRVLLFSSFLLSLSHIVIFFPHPITALFFRVQHTTGLMGTEPVSLLTLFFLLQQVKSILWCIYWGFFPRCCCWFHYYYCRKKTSWWCIVYLLWS